MFGVVVNPSPPAVTLTEVRLPISLNEGTTVAPTFGSITIVSSGSYPIPGDSIKTSHRVRIAG